MKPPIHHPLTSPLIVDGQEFSPEQIIQTLTPILTDERIQRIDEVIRNRSFEVCSVLEKLFDRGNISAVVRTAEVFGFASVHVIELEDKYKVANRVTKGAEKWMAIQRWQNTSECISKLKSMGYQIATTDLNATVEIEEINFCEPTAVVFGSELDGISPEMREQADVSFKFPMHGFTGSFNISVAAALCLSKIHDIRTRALGKSGGLSNSDESILKAHYYLRSVDQPEAILRRSFEA